MRRRTGCAGLHVVPRVVACPPPVSWAAVRHGRFNKETVPTVESHDPYELRRYVPHHVTHIGHFLECIRNERQLHAMIHWFFPSPPYYSYIIDDAKVGQRTASERHVNPTLSRYVLSDPPPHSNVGWRSAKAYLRFPTQPEGVNLRDNYLLCATELLKKLNENTDVVSQSTVRLFGYGSAPRIKASLSCFRAVSADGFDEQIHDVTGKVEHLIEHMDAFGGHMEGSSGAFQGALAEQVHKHGEPRRREDLIASLTAPPRSRDHLAVSDWQRKEVEAQSALPAMAQWHQVSASSARPPP
jgi:hypothetical protein